MLEEEIVASLWGFGFNIRNAQNDRRPENFSLDFVQRNGRKFLRF
jgi:hypothetical protein